MQRERILLIVGGGIAAYKACELVRLMRRAGAEVTCVLSSAGAQFVTPMSLASLSGNAVHTSLWSPQDEAEIGHIQLSRAADLVVVCPATADLLAKMSAGIADDLATTLLLATDTPVLAVPAMNVRMWQHAATRRNVAWLRQAGVAVMEPDEGPMACGEFGPGRLPEPEAIWREIEGHLRQPTGASISGRALSGKHVLVTAGPTHERIDPVRYLANRSSGKQGFAIAAAAAEAGARVTLVAGPVALATPRGVERVDVESALQMEAAVNQALPADAAVMVAAVADWRLAEPADQKIKKHGAAPPSLMLAENPDILADLARSAQRPRLLVGFAAETNDVIEHASRKLAAKGADWIVANDVSGDVMGGDANAVHLLRADGAEHWQRASKQDVARRLVARIAEALAEVATDV
jgi:phosphopantothenoylcysteine decarboxylase/phosphopantothenate--cysteine ligase